jgi:hypothetical protein
LRNHVVAKGLPALLESDQALGGQLTGIRVRRQNLSDEMLPGESIVPNVAPLLGKLAFVMRTTGRNASLATLGVETLMGKPLERQAVQRTLGVIGQVLAELTEPRVHSTAKAIAVPKLGPIEHPVSTAIVLSDLLDQDDLLALLASAPLVHSTGIPVRHKTAFRSDPMLEPALGVRVRLLALIKSVLAHVALQLVDPLLADLLARANDLAESAQRLGEKHVLLVGNGPQRVPID